MLAWALDNVVSRTFADRDPLSVVAWKGLLGGLLSAAVAVVAGEARPSLARRRSRSPAIGAVGYGVSLLCYLRAQALVGAARTASVFAAAPFVGSAVALALGAPWPGVALAGAAALMLAGVWLHASERHRTATVTSRSATSTCTRTTTVTTRLTTIRCPPGRTATCTTTTPSRTSTSTARTCTTGTTTTDPSP